MKLLNNRFSKTGLNGQKFTILHRPSKNFCQSDATNLTDTFASMTRRHAKHPRWIVLFGHHEDVGKIYNALGCYNSIDLSIVTGIDSKDLPFPLNES